MYSTQRLLQQTSHAGNVHSVHGGGISSCTPWCGMPTNTLIAKNIAATRASCPLAAQLITLTAQSQHVAVLLAALSTLATGKAARHKPFAWVFCLLLAVTWPAIQCCAASSMAEGSWHTTVTQDGWLLLLSVLMAVELCLDNRNEDLCGRPVWLYRALVRVHLDACRHEVIRCR